MLAWLGTEIGIALFETARGFLGMFLIFEPLQASFPARRGQGFFRPHWKVDLAFFLGQYLVWVLLVLAILLEFQPWLHALLPLGVRATFNTWPRLVQLGVVVLLGDLCIYWGHRLQHRWDFLWRFHAVHHSSTHLDWLAAHREHPVDTIYSVGIQFLPAFVLGVDLASLGLVIAFRGLWAIFIHSNVRMSLGVLGLAFGSPNFHHWHHAKDRAGVNFGNVCPWTDLLFGTHYDPGYGPKELGLEEPLEQSYLGLLGGPFRGFFAEISNGLESRGLEFPE